MSNDITTVYKDKAGNDHATKGAAKKANRLIDASVTYGDSIGVNHKDMIPQCEDGGIDEQGKDAIEYARAVVAIYGMRDKPEAK